MNQVTPIKNQFTDDFVADCARVSFGKDASQYTPEQNANLINYLIRENHINPAFHGKHSIEVASNEYLEKKLLKEKCLLAGLDLFSNDDDNTWIITGSQFGLLELARHFQCGELLNTIREKSPVLTDAYTKYNNFHNDDKSHELQIIDFNADTPYCHEPFTFKFKTTLDVKNQLYTHCVGMAKSSESHRYIKALEYFTPEFRGKADNVKQGSSDAIVKENHYNLPIQVNDARGEKIMFDIPILYIDLVKMTNGWYDANEHVANECRRAANLQSTAIQYYITGSREAWERVVWLRDTPHAQKEVRQLMTTIKETLK